MIKNFEDKQPTNGNGAFMGTRYFGGEGVTVEKPKKPKDDKTETQSDTDIVETASYSSDAIGSYNKKADDYSTAMSDFRTYLQNMADSIYAEAQKNPLETDWGKGILDYYGVLGSESANAVNAETAAENAGNIDSYAAANAERQRIAKLGQGINTISGMSNDRVTNMINVLNSIGVNTNDLFGTEGQYSVGTAASFADSLYGTDAASTSEYNKLIAGMYGGDGTTSKVPNYEDTKKWLIGVYDDRKNATDTTYGDDEIWAAIQKELLESPEYANYPGYIANIIKEIQAEHTPK